MDSKYIILPFLFALCVNYAVASDKVLLCYYGTWATYRPGLGQVSVSNIDPFVCTHIIYTFVGIQANGTVISLDPGLDLPSGNDNFNKLNALKEINPNLKTILAVGGYNEGSANYSIMANNATYRQNFINTALKFVLDYGFDGFDVDWEYPARRDTVYGNADIENFSTLLKELRAEFDLHGLLITSAVSSVEAAASLSYNIAEISKYLDYINVMAYDLYGTWDTTTGHNAALYPSAEDAGVDPSTLFTVNASIAYWLSQGAPPSKVVLGMPLYGHNFNLTDASNNGVRAPSSGAGFASPYTQTAGIIGYNEMCVLLQNATLGWEVHNDTLAKVPYAVQGINWVSFDNVWSLTEKVNFALAHNLGGVMVWSIETDDIYGQCGETWPLLKAINLALGRNSEANSTTTTTSTTESPTSAPTENPSTEIPTTESSTTERPTTENPSTKPPQGICHDEGFAPNPKDCGSFYMCVVNLYGGYTPVYFDCPAGLHWDQKHSICNYPTQADCQKSN